MVTELHCSGCCKFTGPHDWHQTWHLAWPQSIPSKQLLQGGTVGSLGRGSEGRPARGPLSPFGRGSQSPDTDTPAREGRGEGERCRGLAYLQLLYCFPSFADDQTHFRRRDEELLDRAVAVYVIMKARSVPTAVHDLPQEPFGLSLGGKRITRESALNECLTYPQKGNTKESRPPSIQRQLRPPHPRRPLPSATLLAWNLKATRHNTNIPTQPPCKSALRLCWCLVFTPQTCHFY